MTRTPLPLAAALAVLLLVPALAPAIDYDARPIPQDPARLKKQRAEQLEWTRRSIGGAYDKVGRRSPKWDAAARKALEDIALLFANQAGPDLRASDVHQSLGLAIAAGCDDPMVLYLHNRTAAPTKNISPTEEKRRSRTAAAGLESSAYPAYRRAAALNNHAGVLVELASRLPENLRETERALDAAVAQLPASMAEEEPTRPWVTAWSELLWEIVQGHQFVTKDLVAAHARVDAQLAKFRGAEAMRDELRGRHWIARAWESRSSKFASEVPEAAMRKFEEEIVKARRSLEASWAARPGSLWTAAQMITVKIAIGGDREAMEVWFERAMEIDGDFGFACRLKQDWLDPKWHGSEESTLAFGRACAATRNWRAGIDLLAVEAHVRVSDVRLQEADAAGRDPAAAREAYLGAPAVWSEIVGVYEEHLKHAPRDVAARSHYALMCYQAGKPEESARQFAAMGEDPVGALHYTAEHMKELKRRLGGRGPVPVRPQAP